MEYPKIQSLFKRDENKKIIVGEYTLPEFEYLSDNVWVGFEKIDGTNLRVYYDWFTETVSFKGRTENSQMPSFLLDRLKEIFPNTDSLKEVFGNTDVVLYGEGFGRKIQKVGSRYISNGVDFILFDIRIGSFWLKKDDVEGIAEQLNIDFAPEIFRGNLSDLVNKVSKGFKSIVSEDLELDAEGIVAIPESGLLLRNGSRIITKLKTMDFK